MDLSLGTETVGGYPMLVLEPGRVYRAPIDLTKENDRAFGVRLSTGVAARLSVSLRATGEGWGSAQVSVNAGLDPDLLNEQLRVFSADGTAKLMRVDGLCAVEVVVSTADAGAGSAVVWVKAEAAADPTPHELLYQALSTNGDGTGTVDARGDYSGAATEFKITPAASEVLRVHRMIVSVVDQGTFDADSYGNGIGLTNGIEVQKRDAAGVITDLTAGRPISTNAEWAHKCHDLTLHSFGTGDEHMTVRWTFAKAGEPIRLVGADGEYLTVTLNDDFSGLNGHFFEVQGLYEAA